MAKKTTKSKKTPSKGKKTPSKGKKRTESEERIKQEAEIEVQRLKDILNEAGVSKAMIKALDPIITNTAWMMVKLNDARIKIRGSDIVIPYDNGGGQTGIRENPMFRGYESLWKSYMAGMKQIIDALPEESEEKRSELEKPRTMLEIVRERHKTS